MTARRKRFIAALIMPVILMTTLSGCWDSHELNSMLIITGIALDEASTPDQVDLTLQVGETKAESSGSGEASSQQQSIILLKTTSNTVMDGMMEFNRDSSHKLLMHHNQVLLLGSALAEQGVEKWIDLFMRDQQARLEVPVVVVEGRAADVLSAKPEQDAISGIYLERMLDGMSAVSSFSKVRLLDFTSRLLDGTSSPVAPMIQVVQEGDHPEMKVTGMAVFKGDRMVGQLSNEETAGYLWSMGNVKNSSMEVDAGLGKAAFRITKLNCKRDVSLRQDGGVRVALAVEADLTIDELSGFDDMTFQQLISYLTQQAQDGIRQKITDSFTAARKLDADIYGFGTSVYRKYPKQWRAMKGQWSQEFQNVALEIQVKVHLPAVGQIGRSLEMGAGS